MPRDEASWVSCSQPVEQVPALQMEGKAGPSSLERNGGGLGWCCLIRVGRVMENHISISEDMSLPRVPYKYSLTSVSV